MKQHWINHYVRESQLNYTSIFQNPAQVLSHMFFTNGNGIEFANSNFIVKFDHGKFVPMALMYQQQNEWKHMIKYYMDYELESLYGL